MSKESLKSKATSGFIWNAIERFSVTVAQFIIGIVLARLLSPEDFGLIGMLSIFIAISQVFIDSGMGKGLIQKQDRTEEDYSTVFVFNFVVSLFFYIILFISAPFIASFYEMPLLTSLTRVLSIVLILNSFTIVQRTKLEIEVDFKVLAKVNVIALIVGGGLGIVTALLGFGVWSLVTQTLTVAFLRSLCLWILGDWKFSLRFSKTSFDKLFRYGSNLLLAGIYGKSLQEVYNLVIGKAYSASELGFFTQAKKLATISSSTLSSVLHKVTFPILSALQNDEKKMVSAYSKMIRMAAFITFPTMSLLALVAFPFISLLLGEKWLPAVILLQWLCMGKIVYPISVINMNILNAVGRSDLFLKVDLVKLPLVVATLLIAIPISLEAVVIGQAVTSLISFFINAYMPGKMFGYGSFEQIKEILPTILITLLMAAITYLVMQSVSENIHKITLGITVGGGSYIALSYLFKLDELNEVINIVKKRLKK